MKTALEKNDRQGVSGVFFFGVDSRCCLRMEQASCSINENGELGCFLAHAYGAALDNQARPRCIPSETEPVDRNRHEFNFFVL
jgi:hypothetical protein